MTDVDPDKPAAFPIVPAIMTLALACVVVSGVVGGVLTGLERAEQARLSMIAALICGGAGVIGLLPVWAMSRSQQHGAAYGFMVSILFRMFVAGGAVLIAQWVLKLDYARALSMWIAGWYLLVLVIEVAVVSRHVKSVYPDVHRQTPAVALKSES